ncbi:cation:proton antiporter [Nocardioides marmorisolisilvae]|uniref:Cation:proton antiporter n=1 Tax=Nocardioides marmorisolisilvae TaxID=1542737 RepID=A0A3N0DTQ5_9ACTN|nr:cation:proton antiporter [Nocardioides marmorisolisilvae]RNL79007.1 cation:proton antiporter [Nocardioides marmorisolisilvae]
MPDVAFVNLLGVLVIAALAPIVTAFLPRLRLPAVVLEIVLGVAVGPHALDWLRPDLVVQIVALLGLAMLLFLAGLEVDVREWRGRLLGVVVAGYGISLLVGFAVGLALDGAGWISDPVLLAVTLSATSLGLVVAVLKDAALLESGVARTTITAASLADFAAVVLLSILFSADGRSTASRLTLLALFVGLIGLVVIAATLSARSTRLADVLVALQDGTAEIRVRAAVLLMVGFVVLAEKVGLESILGAFLAGAVVAALDRDATSHPHFRLKLEAVGFGFLVPVFFITSGMRLDVAGLLDHPADLLRVPVFLAALLLARGVPALLFLRDLGRRHTIASGLLLATSLPFIVTATQIGLLTGRMSETTATALVCAGLLSVVVFPGLAIGRAQQVEAEPISP